MEKIDYKRIHKSLYKPSPKNVISVDVPAFNFLMIDGKGDPNTSEDFKIAIEALFSISYTLKFMIKKENLLKEPVDYAVMPLEGLWWADDMSSFVSGNKDDWYWTLMIMQPEFISTDMVTSAVDKVIAKNKIAKFPPWRFESYNEGKCAQIMHIGPFSEEGPTIEKVHQFIEKDGGELAGKHHEIYLSDLRRAAPEKLKTVIRQPYK